MFAYAGLTVTPSRTEISLVPGGSFEGSMTVRNDNDVPANVFASVRDWFVLPENKGLTASDWLVIVDSEVYLKPAETRDIKYEVRLSTAAQGSLVAMMSFVPQIEGDQGGITLMVSVSVFVTAKGTEKIDWDVSDVKIDDQTGKLQFSAVVANNGNVHLRPVGNVVIYSKTEVVDSFNFSEGRPSYPGTPRSFVAVSKSDIKPGKYIAKINLQCYGQMKEKEVKFKIDKKGVAQIIK